MVNLLPQSLRFLLDFASTGAIIMRRLIVILLLLCSFPVFAQEATEEVIPEAMPLIDEGDADIINVLLIGAATRNPNNPGLTDMLIIVSLNRDSGHIALVSLPRDLYVYVPDVEMMKINQVYFSGERGDGDTGIERLYATIRYNLGIEIDYYAKVDFDSFPQLVDSVGGIDITVDCAIEDWRLIEPDMDIHVAENYEMFTLWTGHYHMDGDTALWYVRSRRTSNDLDRNRRQQDVLRALWRQIRSQGLLENFPQLWEQFNEIVETDIPLSEALNLLPIVADLEPAQMEYYYFRIHHEVEQGYGGDNGQFIFTPQPEAVRTMMEQVLSPSTSRRLNSDLPTVVIYNGSGLDWLPYIAAQRLEREGFLTTIVEGDGYPRQYNHVIDYTGLSRGNPVSEIQRVLRITDDGLATEPDPNREYDYAVYIGWQYQYFSCTYPVQQPVREEATPEASQEN
jgi:LCP family protein required for cell wall assembly